MRTETVTVWLDPGAFGLPGDPIQAIRFDVEADTHTQACEIAFAVCNSYASDDDHHDIPDELFCDYSYRDVVVEYRARRHRSLSVGDYVQVGMCMFYRCDTIGWKPGGFAR